MRDAQVVEERSGDDRLEWSDVEAVAGELFTVWMGDGDMRWAEAAWKVLSQTNLTRYASEVDRTVCIARLVALNALYREFCVYAFEEGSTGDWRYEITDDLFGDYPFVDAFSLGQLAEQREIYADNSLYADGNPRTEVLRQVAIEEYPGVVEALHRQWGENELFASLYVSQSEHDDLYPTSTDVLDEVFDPDPSIGMQRAYAWHTDGMPL